MAKKGKEASSVDLYYLGQAEKEEKEKKKKQAKSQEAKKNSKKKKREKTKKETKENTTKSVSSKLDDAYNMEEEIIIGIPKSTPPPKQKKKEQKKKKPKKVQATKIAKEPQKKSQKNSVTNKKLTPKQGKAQKRRKLILAIVKWMVLCALLIGSLIYFLLSPLFNITDIVIEGNSKITTEQIQSLSQIKLGDNIFKMRKSEVIQNIKENPYIDSVIVHRNLPNVVEVEVKERQATLQLQYINSYVYLNNQGYLLEISNQKLNSPVLRGIVTKEEDIKPGNRLVKEDLEKLEVVLSILESAKSNGLGEKITQIDIQEKNNFVLYLDAEQKIVYIGDEKDLSTKMLWIKTILEKEQGVAGEIFLNQGMDSVYFREKV